MGQKINPIGFRLGVIRTWDSKWFDEKNFDKKYGKLVNDTALEISKKLGYIPA